MNQENIYSLHLNESGAPTGGAERYLIALHQALKQSGNPALLVYGRNEPNTYMPSGASKIIDGIDSIASTTSPLEIFLELLERESPDLIHFHNLTNFTLVSQTASSQTSLRTVHDSRLVCPLEFRLQKNGDLCREAVGQNCLVCMNEFGIDNREASEKLSQTLAEIEAAKKLALILTPSNYIKEQLLLNGFSEEKILILPPFLLNESQIESIVTAPETTDLLFVGRIVQSKGLHLLLESMKLLPESTTLTVVGDGPDLNADKNFARVFGLENRVYFAGWQSADNLNRFYQQSKMLVVPSMGPEAFGLVGLEAMAMAKPIVAFDSGGINQWLNDQVNGFLIPRGDIQTLTDRINQLLSDQETRVNMGNEGLQMIKAQFNQKTHVEKLLTIYRKLAN